MKNVGINDGHTISGPGSGAVGIINESEHTRKVGNALRNYLKDNGANAINCTIDYSSSVGENLSLIVQQANRQELDWFISIHFNAGGGQGVEVYTYEGRQYQDALDVCTNISNTLGIPNRGVKAGTGLYVIRKTKAKSMLIEVCFVDTDDANKYLSVGHDVVAKAIAEALLGHINESVKEEVKPTPSPEPTVDTQYEKAKRYNAARCKELQEKLNVCGFSVGTADGIYGPKTHTSLGNFQLHYGLTADYLAGNVTFAKLDSVIANSNQGNEWVRRLQQECNKQGFSKQTVDGIPGPATLAGCPVLKKGAKGNITKLLQEKLVKLGYSTNGVDGIFGSGTHSAVREFQKTRGLSVDGIVGQNTWRKLLNL